jgi:hypothetical protein
MGLESLLVLPLVPTTYADDSRDTFLVNYFVWMLLLNPVSIFHSPRQEMPAIFTMVNRPATQGFAGPRYHAPFRRPFQETISFLFLMRRRTKDDRFSMKHRLDLPNLQLDRVNPNVASTQTAFEQNTFG